MQHPWSPPPTTTAPVTARPPRRDPLAPQVPPPVREPRDTMRAKVAAHHATTRYPGPVGELICDHLRWHAEGGWRVPDTSLTARLVDEMLRPPP